MNYSKTIILKNGQEAIIRSGLASDAQAVLDNFNLAHEETDFLLTYPDESTMDVEQEAKYLEAKFDSPNEVELLAIVDGKVAGTAGIDSYGQKYKVKHRSDLGISIVKEYWGLGIGRALMNACIECAKEAGYEQIELQVVADNERAVSLYKRVGFVEFGRNTLGFKSRTSGYQELIYMVLRFN